MSTQRSTPDEFRTPDAYPLRIGDRVTDIQQLVEDEPQEFGREPETAIVIDTPDGDVHSVTFENHHGEEVALAEYGPNQQYADFAISVRVVRIAWEGWLDSNTPGWKARRDDPESLSDYLAQREESWDVPVSTYGSYDYPESRLRLEDRP